MLIARDLNYEQTAIVGRYAGRAPGHVVVLMPNDISDRSKDLALLSPFRDYAPKCVGKENVPGMSVFCQSLLVRYTKCLTNIEITKCKLPSYHEYCPRWVRIS
jgi:hypothetical protein